MPLEDIPPRQHIDLCGTWRFQPDFFLEGETRQYFAPAFDLTRWREVRVPCTFDQCLPELASCETTGWFRRSVVIPEAWEGKRVLLRCEGINYHAQVWVNGEQAGRNDDGFLRIEWLVQSHLRYGCENEITLRVDNIRRQGEVPGMQRGWRPYGGILRELSLEAGDPCHLEQIDIEAMPTADGGGAFRLKIDLVNGRPTQLLPQIVTTLRDANGTVLQTLSLPVSATPGEIATTQAECTVPAATPWSPEHPVLYFAEIALCIDERVIDMQVLRFGFRKIEALGEQLLLNGQPIFLMGFNRHEDSARTQMCPDMELVRADLLAMKQMGCNFIRLCHYPHHPAELDLCDELGLLVMSEIPLWWWNGNAEGEEHCRAKLQAAKRQLTRMLARDGHHPSIIFWSVSNENEENLPEVVEGNAELVRFVQGLDASRLATHVSCYWPDHPRFEADDMLCVNAYPNWSTWDDIHCRQAEAWWREKLEALHARYPGRPILVTEFGHGAIAGTFDHALGEDAQTAVIAAEFAAFTAPYLCGAAIWCYADHAWPEENFIDYMTTSPFGVVTRERQPKQACAVAQRLFTQRAFTENENHERQTIS